MYSAKSTEVVIVCVIMSMFAILGVLLRVQARRNRRIPLQLNDHIMIGALIVTLIQNAVIIYGCIWAGIGAHTSQLTPYETVNFAKVIFALQILVYCFLPLIKISVVLFFRIVFCCPQMTAFSWITIAFVASWTMAFLLLVIFQTWPISDAWTEFSIFADTKVSYSGYTATDIITDVAILVLPLPIINGMYISRKEKLIIMGILGFSGFCVVASSIKFHFVLTWQSVKVDLYGDGTRGSGNHPHGHWNGTGGSWLGNHPNHTLPTLTAIDYYTSGCPNTMIWTAIEPCASIICACLPIILASVKKAVITYITRVARKCRVFWAWSLPSFFSSFFNKRSSLGSVDGRGPTSMDPASRLGVRSVAMGAELDDFHRNQLPSVGILVSTKVESGEGPA